MKVLLMLFISGIAFSATWVLTDIDSNLTIRFPKKPKVDTTTFKRYKLYTSSNENCDFSIGISDIPKMMFPKNDKEALEILEREVLKSKKEGVFISSEKFTLGNIKGVQIKEYFTPTPKIKLIQINRDFFIKYKRYNLRCLYKAKTEAACEADCKRFLSSLKLIK